MTQRFRSATALVLAVSFCCAPLAAFGQSGQVQPQDVMGDRNRAGPDGWSQAPTPRVEAPSAGGTAPGEQNKAQSPDVAARPQVPNTAQNVQPGDDPGTPMPSPDPSLARPNQP